MAMSSIELRIRTSGSFHHQGTRARRSTSEATDWVFFVPQCLGGEISGIRTLPVAAHLAAFQPRRVECPNIDRAAGPGRKRAHEPVMLPTGGLRPIWFHAPSIASP
jgi:hypothetical protein